jgi:hypothetical protein
MSCLPTDGNASPVCEQTRCFLQGGPQLRQGEHGVTAMRVAEPHLLAAPQERFVHVLICDAPNSTLRTPAKCKLFAVICLLQDLSHRLNMITAYYGKRRKSQVRNAMR